MVVSTGGHLKQLHRLRTRLEGLDRDALWVTFDSPQSRSLLDGEQVIFARYTGSRDPANVARNALLAERVLRSRSFTAVVSTGSAVALSFLPLARARGIPSHFIESAARSAGPSLTGRLIGRVPGIKLYSQYPGWAKGRWRYAGSVFDAFGPASRAASRPMRRVVVTLGTMEHGFRRLVEALAPLLPPEAEVLWQTGATDVSGLGVRAVPSLPAHELEEAMREADVVVAHAGTGAALSAFEAGRAPLLVPRRAALGEHTDDHQLEVAAELGRRGLAMWREADELRPDDLERVAGLAVEERPDVPAFRL
jgi:UDP-N-acetylglucosamine--N-acetylmuramyl-(pentapeptide) pyrophosphoryl-undecaprenol N-acetylglucosamine transferase